MLVGWAWGEFAVNSYFVCRALNRLQLLFLCCCAMHKWSKRLDVLKTRTVSSLPPQWCQQGWKLFMDLPIQWLEWRSYYICGDKDFICQIGMSLCCFLTHSSNCRCGLSSSVATAFVCLCHLHISWEARGVLDQCEACIWLFVICLLDCFIHSDSHAHCCLLWWEGCYWMELNHE